MSKESHSRTETSKRLRLGPELRTYFLSPTPAHDPNPLSGPQRFEVFFAPDAEIVRRNPPFGRHRRTTLDVIGLEAFVPEPPRGPGRPPEDRRALARAFVAKAVLGVPTTSALIERLDVDKSLRRILGWERRSQVPSEATFSRAFAEFARGELPDKIHAALIERALGGRIIGTIARDATEIEA